MRLDFIGIQPIQDSFSAFSIRPAAVRATSYICMYVCMHAYKLQMMLLRRRLLCMLVAAACSCTSLLVLGFNDTTVLEGSLFSFVKYCGLF
jgi:hypothetical protein